MRTDKFNKVGNEYADILAEPYEPGDKHARYIYSQTPKAVIAAIAVSMLTLRTEQGLSDVPREFVREWWTLYENGIVPQKPPFPKPAEVL